jgi:hypothetical protein
MSSNLRKFLPVFLITVLVALAGCGGSTPQTTISAAVGVPHRTQPIREARRERERHARVHVHTTTPRRFGTVINPTPEAIGIVKTSNTILGKGAFASNATGVEDSVYGYEALSSSTAGSRDTCTGARACKTTTANADTADGTNVLEAATTGNENTGAGAFVFEKLTEGKDNNGFGDEALKNLTTGVEDVADGNKAILDATTANENVAVGNESGEHDAAGSKNAWVGYRAGRLNTEGERNAFVGMEAGIENTTGNKNCGLGYNALNENKTGNEDCAVGTDALPGPAGVLGSKNNALGFKAAFDYEGEGSLFLGNEAGAGLKTGNNKLYIANSSTEEPLILGSFGEKYVKIFGTLEPKSGLKGKEIIETEQLGKESVAEGKIKAEAVGTSQLATNGVTTAKIKTENISEEKFTKPLQEKIVKVETANAQIERTKGSEIEPSAAHVTFVLLEIRGKTLTETEVEVEVGGTVVGKCVAGSGTATVKPVCDISIMVPASKKYEVVSTTNIEKVFSSYTS